jgi:hypothetical protein
MKVRLQISKNGTPVYEATCDVSDAESFGKACADMWWKVRQGKMDKESSIGALMEHLDEDVEEMLAQFDGCRISLKKA